MNKQKQIEAAARLEFGNAFDCIESNTLTVWLVFDRGTPEERHGWRSRCYFHDHNAIQRLVDGMDSPSNMSGVYQTFLYELDAILTKKHYASAIDETFLVTDYYCLATCAQKLEAILKAYGKWEPTKELL